MSCPTPTGTEELRLHKWPVRLLEEENQKQSQRGSSSKNALLRTQRSAANQCRARWLPGDPQDGSARPKNDLQVLGPRKETLALPSCRKKVHIGPGSTKSRRMQIHAAWMPLNAGKLAGANSAPLWCGQGTTVYDVLHPQHSSRTRGFTEHWNALSGVKLCMCRATVERPQMTAAVPLKVQGSMHMHIGYAQPTQRKSCSTIQPRSTSINCRGGSLSGELLG